MDERQQINVENLVGSRVMIQLHSQAFDMLEIQGVESKRFVAMVAGLDGFGVWIENPNFCTVPTYSEQGNYIPPEERQEICDRAVILVMWPHIQTIMQFPDRQNYHTSVAESEIGFRARLQPASVVAQELTPIGVTTDVPLVNGKLIAPAPEKGSNPRGKVKKGSKRG